MSYPPPPLTVARLVSSEAARLRIQLQRHRPLALHTRPSRQSQTPGKQGSPSPPHVAHTRPNAHVPVLHPAQQACQSPPQPGLRQIDEPPFATQTCGVAQEPPQHGSPGLPQLRHVPTSHVLPAAQPEPQHGWFVAPQARHSPATHCSPAAQVGPGQHGCPPRPHGASGGSVTSRTVGASSTTPVSTTATSSGECASIGGSLLSNSTPLSCSASCADSAPSTAPSDPRSAACGRAHALAMSPAHNTTASSLARIERTVDTLTD